VSGPSAIAPYTWRADYRGGGRLHQFEVTGPHFAHEIDRARLHQLVLEGPGGTLFMAPRAVPDAVVLRARTTIAPGGQQPERRVILAGYRYGALEDVLELDVATGAVARYTGPPITTPPDRKGGVCAP
jgi:hypothetical protein